MYNQKTNELGFFKKAINVDWFAGMGTTIHKSVFEKVGYLDYERFPQYHGDSDFTYMAKKSGFNLVAYPNLIIYNDVFNTGSTHDLTFKSLFYSFFDLKSKYNIKKELQFFKKHGKSIIAYNFILRKYFFYVGGFIKWKFLSIFGIQKSIN